jgi:hypothetical protein
MHSETCRMSRTLVAALLLAAAATARAQGVEPEETGVEPAIHVHHHDGSAEPGDEAHHHGTPGHGFQHLGRNHLMVMAAPGTGSKGGDFVSAGVGYERRLPYLHDLVGMGAMAELMFMSGHAPHPMLMASASLRPVGGLYLQAALGVSHVHEDGTSTTSGTGGSRMSTKGVFRLSSGYDFHAGSVMLTPYVNADVGGSSRRAISAGFCVGRMF